MKKYYFASILSLTALLFLSCASKSSVSKPNGSKHNVFNLLEQGKTQEAQALFTSQASLNERDGNGRTALHAAVETGNTEMVRFLLAMGAEVDALDNDDRTPLVIAAEKSDPGTSRLLAAAGADIHHQIGKDSSDSPALRGVRHGGTFLESLINPQTINSRGSGGYSLIHLAARGGWADSAGTIIAAGALINEKDDSGKTALDHAFEGTGSIGHAGTAERLVLAGGFSNHPLYTYFAPAARSANYNFRAADGNTALHFAAQEGYTGYISFMLDKKADIKVDINIKNNSGATALHEACRMGNLETIKLLIERGSDINAQDANGNTALHLASPLRVHEQVVVMLLSSQANPNLRDEHGETPLHVMIALGRPRELIYQLLSRHADVTARNIEGKTALHLAVEKNRVDLIPLLLTHRADIFAADNRNLTPLENALKDNNSAVIDLLITNSTVLQSDSAGNTPLHIVVKIRNDTEVAELILNRNGLVNARNKEGNTALHIAVMENHEAPGTLLISRGADIFSPNSKGDNPLFLAFPASGQIREWMLTQKTLEAKDGLGNTALHYGAQWKLAAHVPLLVRNGSKLEAVNATGETPLFVAARADSPETIRALLTAGASINARDALGNSPLHSAVRWNAQNSIEPLVNAGNNINAQNLAGLSPLHEAVHLGLSASETTLIRLKANIEIRDAQGNTPLMAAVENSSSGSLERLINSGADPITRNKMGNTPLHIAVSNGRRDLATLLLNCGAPIHARNSYGVTPFQIALNSPVMVTTLLTKDRIIMADDEGLSPLHIAIKQGASLETIKTIIQQGCRVSAIDSEGRTALRLALDQDSLEAAKILTDAGSDVFAPAADGKIPATAALLQGEKAVRALFSGNAINARDNTGNTVLHYAAQTGRTDMIAILLELGANKNTRNIAAESPADIAQRWNYDRAAAMLQ
ncbi:MAG: ankyrin repeat domain-containing protein [Treponema sp.]|jgi:ankyrin repeat protein|nr:ankyrin repeat domain-containing protein [Treponema sp.]